MSVREFDGFIYGLRLDFRKFLVNSNKNERLFRKQENIKEFTKRAFKHCTSNVEENIVIENLTEVFREFMEECSEKEETA